MLFLSLCLRFAFDIKSDFTTSAKPRESIDPPTQTGAPSTGKQAGDTSAMVNIAVKNENMPCKDYFLLHCTLYRYITVECYSEHRHRLNYILGYSFENSYYINIYILQNTVCLNFIGANGLKCV